MTSSIAAQFTDRDRQVLGQITSLSDFEKHVNQDRLANSEKIKKTSLYFQELLTKISTERDLLERIKDSQKSAVQYLLPSIRDIMAACTMGLAASIPCILYFSSDWKAVAVGNDNRIITIEKIWQNTVFNIVIMTIFKKLTNKFFEKSGLKNTDLGVRIQKVRWLFMCLIGLVSFPSFYIGGLVLFKTQDEQLKQYRNIIAPICAGIAVIRTVWIQRSLDKKNNEGIISRLNQEIDSLAFLHQAITLLTPST